MPKYQNSAISGIWDLETIVFTFKMALFWSREVSEISRSGDHLRPDLRGLR